MNKLNELESVRQVSLDRDVVDPGLHKGVVKLEPLVLVLACEKRKSDKKPEGNKTKGMTYQRGRQEICKGRDGGGGMMQPVSQTHKQERSQEETNSQQQQRQ